MPISRVRSVTETEHDVHDDDAADDERDESDGGQHGAEGVGDGRGELDESVVGVELEGVFGAGFVVAGGAHEDTDFVGGGFEPGAGRAGLDVDGEGLLGAVGLLVGGEGDADEVILRGAEGAALLFDDADDGVGDAVGAELLAEGLDAGEEVFLDVGADDGDVGGVFFVGGSEVAALGDVEVLEGGHLPGEAADLRVGDGGGAADELAGDGLLGAGAGAAFAVFLDVFEVGVEDVFAFGVLLVVVGIGGERGGAGDGEGVGAVGGELGLDEEVGAVDEGDDGDDGRDADDDAEQGKHGAELVAPEGGEREFERFFEFHEIVPGERKA